MAFINVILSGGVGSRLWPLSRKSRPKQYIPLLEGQSLFELCIDRNKDHVARFLVVGSVDNYRLSQEAFAKMCIEGYNEIIESVPRNTAASIAFAALASEEEDILLISPSDHVIKGEGYLQALGEAQRLAAQGYLVTFGAVPTRAETGYGYIEFAADNQVLSFREKPDAATAQNFVESGRFLWNSGMFCFKAGTFLAELALYAPEILESAKLTWEARSGQLLPKEEMMRIPSKSVDYALMEQSKKIKVVPFDFDWNDLGSFESLWEYMDQQKPASGRKNLVLGSQKHVELIGLEGLIVVETDDVLMILPRERSQEVKQVYERLEKEDSALLD